MPNEIPDYQTLMLPVLRQAAGGDTSVPEVVERVGKEMGLSQEQLARAHHERRLQRRAPLCYYGATHMLDNCHERVLAVLA